MEKSTRKEILIVSGILGCALIVFELIGRGLAWLVRYFYSSGLLTRTFNTSCLFQIIYTLTAILLPFFIASKIIEKRQNRTHEQILPFGPPKNYILFLCALGVGFMAVMLSNALTSMFVVSMNNHGITFDSANVDVPTSASGYFWIIIADALVPSLCEEYALRGVVMGSLRKYGDSMAIGISSLLFALMHGNMTQAPFAFLLGLVIGRLVIATNSMWTGITIHFLNNLFAVIMTIVSNKESTMTTAVVTIIAVVVAIAMGLISIVILREVYHWGDIERLNNPGSTVQEKRVNRWSAELYTIISLPMTVSLIWLFWQLFSTVHRG